MIVPKVRPAPGIGSCYGSRRRRPPEQQRRRYLPAAAPMIVMGPSCARRRRGSPWIPTFLVAMMLLCTCTPVATAECINDYNVCDGDGEAYRPIGGCREYAHCVGGKLSSKFPCAEGAIYDVLVKRCNWEYAAFCIPKSCPPTSQPSASPSASPSYSPSASPSESPTDSPSASPSVSPSATPSASPSYSPTNFPTYDFFATLDTESMKEKFESTVLQSYNPAGIASPSTKYSFEGLIDALRQMVSGISSGGRTFKFYTSSQRLDYGQTNLAAFLANAMTESIAYDTCDEFNTDSVADRFAVSNACGQNSRSYQDEVCTKPEERDMSCPVDVDMEMVSSGYSTGMMGRAPPPFSCRPKESDTDYAGYWDDRTGASSNTAYANALGRTDLEGCCWWGRGALLTRNVCNIGKLNYYLGKRAYHERGEGKFPNVDFCQFPEATCANEEGKEGTEEIRWLTGLFEWVERIQHYPDWDYEKNLEAFVDGGMKDDNFIDTVNTIFTTDCHEAFCSRREVTKKEERKENFKRVLAVFGLPDVTAAPTLSRPRPPPTPKPTTGMPFTPSPVKSILAPSLTVPQPAPEPVASDPTVPMYLTPPLTPSNPSQGIQPAPPPYEDNGAGPVEPPIEPPVISVQPTSQIEPLTPSTTTSTMLPTIEIDGPTDNTLISVEDNSASLLHFHFWIASLAASLTLATLEY